MNQRSKKVLWIAVPLTILAVIALIDRLSDWTFTSAEQRAKAVPEIVKQTMRDARLRNTEPPSKYIVMHGQFEDAGEYSVHELHEMIEGVYRGRISIEAASKYVFTRTAFGTIGFDDIIGDFILYHANGSSGSKWDFVLPRNREFEEAHRNGKSMEDYIESLHGFVEYNLDNPANEKDGLRVTGFETFRTTGGLVKQVPIVEAVFIPRS